MTQCKLSIKVMSFYFFFQNQTSKHYTIYVSKNFSKNTGVRLGFPVVLWFCKTVEKFKKLFLDDENHKTSPLLFQLNFVKFSVKTIPNSLIEVIHGDNLTENTNEKKNKKINKERKNRCYRANA